MSDQFTPWKTQLSRLKRIASTNDMTSGKYLKVLLDQADGEELSFNEEGDAPDAYRNIISIFEKSGGKRSTVCMTC